MKPLTLRLTRSVLLFASFLLPSACSLAAQQDTARTLTGTVTGNDQKPIQGAVVKLQNNATKLIVSYITDAGGTYTFKRLSSTGDYTVWAAWKGQRSKQKSLDHFNTAADPKIDLNVDSH